MVHLNFFFHKNSRDDELYAGSEESVMGEWVSHSVTTPCYNLSSTKEKWGDLRFSRNMWG